MVERVVIVDYGSGNLRSVEKAFERVARGAGIAAAVDVTADAEAIAAADRVVLPGVGAFAACMEGLAGLDGALAALEHAVLVSARPFLGICVGMQLLARKGLEFGQTRGLGWIDGVVRPLAPVASDGVALPVPHTGWNVVRFDAPWAPNLEQFDNKDFYFVHSFHFDVENAANIIGLTAYGGDVVAAVHRDNILGVQFHPEKSQAAGLAFLEGFLKWRP